MSGHACDSRVVRSSRFFSSRLRVLLIVCLILIFLLSTIQRCQRSPRSPQETTITLIDQSWLEKELQDRRNREISEFTKETGIRVKVLPSPEAPVDQVSTWLSLLQNKSQVPDVYALDVIWPGILADYLIDLRPYVPAQEITVHFPDLIANDTVDGRLIALPYHIDTGLLYHRPNLLRRYGYSGPPQTWEELERMAVRIQAGERARGQNNLWGFLWEGAPSEALTCNALEWQVSEGGGAIIDNGKMTLNNPKTIRAWEGAAR
jgi:trehalose/maltose transport system substrate-binding protein